MSFADSKWLLVGCAVIIVLGLGILAVDRWVVKRDQPDRVEQLAVLVEELGLTRHDDDAAELRVLLEPFADTLVDPERLGPVLSRPDGERRLWLFEFTERETALRRRAAPDVDVELSRFGILFELGEGPALPAWSQAGGEAAPAPPHTVDSVARLNRLSDYSMATAARALLFVSRPAGWSLMQAMEQRTSPEFHPGLLNSAMRIDVQMALDTIEAMDLGIAPPRRFYDIDIGPIDLPTPDAAGLRGAIEAGTTAAKAKMDAELAEMRERMARDREANRAKWEATLQQFRERSGIADESGTAADSTPEPEAPTATDDAPA